MGTLEDGLVQIHHDLKVGKLSVAARGAYWSLSAYQSDVLSDDAIRQLLGERWRELAAEIERAGLGHVRDAGKGLLRFVRTPAPDERRRERNRQRMQRSRNGK